MLMRESVHSFSSRTVAVRQTESHANVKGGVKPCVEMHNAKRSPSNKWTSKRERQKDRGQREREREMKTRRKS